MVRAVDTAKKHTNHTQTSPLRLARNDTFQARTTQRDDTQPDTEEDRDYCSGRSSAKWPPLCIVRSQNFSRMILSTSSRPDCPTRQSENRYLSPAAPHSCRRVKTDGLLDRPYSCFRPGATVLRFTTTSHKAHRGHRLPAGPGPCMRPETKEKEGKRTIGTIPDGLYRTSSGQLGSQTAHTANVPNPPRPPAIHFSQLLPSW